MEPASLVEVQQARGVVSRGGGVPDRVRQIRGGVSTALALRSTRPRAGEGGVSPRKPPRLVSSALRSTRPRGGPCPQEQATPLRTNVVSPPHRRLLRSRPGDGNRQNPQRTAASLRSTPTRFVKLVSKQPRGDDCTCSRVPQGALLALRHTKLSHPHPPKAPQ
jgi:hypothetical protein